MRSSAKAKLVLCLLTACAIALSSLGAQSQKKTAVFTPDKGKFTIQLDGQVVGHEEFDISASSAGWTAHGTTELKTADAPATRVTGALTLQPNGAPISYEWSSQAEKTNGARIVFANGVAKITLQMEGAHPFEQDMTFNTPLIAVLDNNLYYQYGVLARVYDWSKQGTQTLPVLIPQELTPGSVNVDATGSVTANGKSYDGLSVTTSDLQVLLFLDSNHRLMRLEVPAAKVAVSRD